METILILAHTEPDGSLAKPMLEAFAAGVALHTSLPGSQLVAGFIGENTQAAAKVVAGCGAARFLAVSGPDFVPSRYSTDAAAAEAIVKAAQATIVVAPHTSRFGRCLAGVAQRLGGRADTHVTSISVDSGTIGINRWFYRQRMEAVAQRAQRPWFMLIDPGSHSAWTGSPGQVALETVSPPAISTRTVVGGFREPPATQQTVRPEAALLFVAGAGWTKKQGDGQTHVSEAEKLIGDFLALTRASLGSSKSLVDQGGDGQAVLSFLSHFNQIGQTGSTPRHPKGLSTCCHGEEPHTVGWRFINERRAISLDPNCGWARGKADVLYVADAFKVVAELSRLLKQQ
jgi:electron transfer flavoprotein alpha subunit